MRASWRYLVLALVLGLGLGGCQLGQPVAAPVVRAERYGPFFEVTSPHFVVNTNVPNAEAVKLAARLEKTRAALLDVAWGGASGPPGRVSVVAFARPQQLSHFTSRALAGEAIHREGSRPIIVFRVGSNGQVASVAAHELVHVLNTWAMARQPTWFAEGMAGFLETVRVVNNGTRVVVALPPADRAVYLNAETPAWDTAQLFEVRSVWELDMGLVHSFYARAWLLVHYLVMEHGDAFAAFQHELRRHADWREAYQQTMPKELAPGPSLDKLLQQHWAAREEWVFVNHEQPAAAEVPVQVRRLSNAAVHGLLARISHESAQAQQHAEIALRRDPGDLNALSVAFEFSTESVARSLAVRATTLHPESAEAWVLALRSAPEGAPKAAALARARALDPYHPVVLQHQSWLALQNKQPQAAQKYADLAMRCSATTLELLGLYAVALAGQHRCSDAVKVLLQVQGRDSDAYKRAVASACAEP